jgi:hypothetical protein
MYKVIITNRSNYNKAVLAVRYCYTERSVVDLAVAFTKMNCDIYLEKFVCRAGKTFGWIKVNADQKIWEKIEEALDNEFEE